MHYYDNSNRSAFTNKFIIPLKKYAHVDIYICPETSDEAASVSDREEANHEYTTGGAHGAWPVVCGRRRERGGRRGNVDVAAEADQAALQSAAPGVLEITGPGEAVMV